MDTEGKYHDLLVVVDELRTKIIALEKSCEQAGFWGRTIARLSDEAKIKDARILELEAEVKRFKAITAFIPYKGDT